ncbi:MAG TPA: hypothetical protein VJZ27_17285, partial [Aggregatilineales bacterium]|nr:hypothetical protein [Aggregatilineales bacterium]
LTFILWSHVIPGSVQNNRDLPAFSSQNQTAGAVMGLIVMVMVAGFFIYTARPQEPYGYSQRQWDRGLRDEQKQEVIDSAENTFRTFTVPYFIVMSLFPGAGIFFATREMAASAGSMKEEESVQAVAV